MNDAQSQASYTPTAQVLHWLIAGLIVVQYVLAEFAEEADESGHLVAQLALLANHKSVGMTILALATVRIGWRLMNPPPPLPHSMPTWQRRISGLTHALIYLAIFAIPVSGWLMSSASAYSVSWFNLFAFPDFISPNEGLAERFEQIHHLAAEGLFILVLLHAAAALKHHFFDKDTVLKRMTSIASLSLFALAIGVSAVTLIPQASETQVSSAPESSSKDVALETNNAIDDRTDSDSATTYEPVAPAANPSSGAWSIDYDASEISFTGDQAGAPFTGRFDEWEAEIHFDLSDPEQASARVFIELASVNSFDADRDDTARGSDWFDVDNTPRATFVTDRITALSEAGTFSAQGNLTIGQVTAEVSLALSAEQSGSRVDLTGETTLQRTVSFNLGRGDWQDTDWVGEDIAVSITLIADVAEAADDAE